MKIKGYELCNPDKIDRALYGNPISKDVDGNPVRKGGVAKEDGSYDENALLSEYDKLGGLIKNDEGSRVLTGSFYDFKKRKPREVPEVKLTFRISVPGLARQVINIDEGERKPDIVRAAQEIEKMKSEVGKKKTKKAEKE